MSIYNHTTNGTEVQQKSDGAKPDTYKLKPQLLDNANVDPQLSWFDFCVLYRLLAHYCHETELCCPSIKWLAEALHTSPRNVKRAIQNLLAAKWISVQHRYQETSLYTFACDRAVKLDLSNPNRSAKSGTSKECQFQHTGVPDLTTGVPNSVFKNTRSGTLTYEGTSEEKTSEETNTRKGVLDFSKGKAKEKAKEDSKTAKDAPGTVPHDKDDSPPQHAATDDHKPPPVGSNPHVNGSMPSNPHATAEAPDVDADQSQAARAQFQADHQELFVWATYQRDANAARNGTFAFPQGILDHFDKYGSLTDDQITTAERFKAKDKTYQLAKAKRFGPGSVDAVREQMRQSDIKSASDKEELQKLILQEKERLRQERLGQPPPTDAQQQDDVDEWMSPLLEAEEAAKEEVARIEVITVADEGTDLSWFTDTLEEMGMGQ